MAQAGAMPSGETLDPEDWESARALGHRMLDDMLDYMKAVRERPVWHHIPAEVKAHFNGTIYRWPQKSCCAWWKVLSLFIITFDNNNVLRYY